MNKMILAVCLMVLAAAGCGADTTAQCRQEADCANVSKDLTCVTLTAGKSIAGENGQMITDGSWCAERPKSCTDALKAFCTATGLVCVEANGAASCQGADGTKTGCSAITCANGESCVEVSGQGICVKTCNQDVPDCPNEKFCGAHPVATMISVCLPDLDNNKTCNRPEMCISNNCPVVADPTKRVCAAVANPQCTGDNAGQGCNAATQFCNVAMSCEAKRVDGSVCQKATMCVTGVCTKAVGATDGVCGTPVAMCTGDLMGQGCNTDTQFCNTTLMSVMCEARRPGGAACQKNSWCQSLSCVSGICQDSHPTNCGSKTLVIPAHVNASDPYVFGISVGQKKIGTEVLKGADGINYQAPSGTWVGAWPAGASAPTSWIAAGSYAYCPNDWLPHVTSYKEGVGFLVTTVKDGAGNCDPVESAKTLKPGAWPGTLPTGVVVCGASGATYLITG